MFWIGILPALPVFYDRRKVREPEMYTKTRQTIIAGHTGSFEIFRPNLRITARRPDSHRSTGRLHAITTRRQQRTEESSGREMRGSGNEGAPGLLKQSSTRFSGGQRRPHSSRCRGERLAIDLTEVQDLQTEREMKPSRLRAERSSRC
jgi:hypothetical protein